MYPSSILADETLSPVILTLGLGITVCGCSDDGFGVCRSSVVAFVVVSVVLPLFDAAIICAFGKLIDGCVVVVADALVISDAGVVVAMTFFAYGRRLLNS